MNIQHTDISEFAAELEKAGFTGALRFVTEELLPIAQELTISLPDAAWAYADQDEEQDTSMFQLFHALQKLPARA